MLTDMCVCVCVVVVKYRVIDAYYGYIVRCTCVRLTTYEVRRIMNSAHVYNVQRTTYDVRRTLYGAHVYDVRHTTYVVRRMSYAIYIYIKLRILHYATRIIKEI